MSFTPDLPRTSREQRILKTNKKKDYLPNSNDPAEIITQNTIKLKKNWFPWLIKKRTTERRNSIILVLGETRSGKSWSALSLASIIDMNGDFDESHIMFKVSDFIERIQKTPERCTLVLDETGAELSARKFQSTMNILTGALLQTWGSRYINLILCLPTMTLTDKTIRTLSSFSLRIRSRGWADIYSHWVDVFTSEPYKRNCGVTSIISPLDLPLPKKHVLWPPEHTQETPEGPCYNKKNHDKKLCYEFWNDLIYKYEMKKRKYQQETYADMYEKIAKIENADPPTRKKTLNIKAMVDEIIKSPNDFMLRDEKTLDNSLIQAHFETSGVKANQIKSVLRKKYNLKKGDDLIDAIKK